jgi:peptide methionine sulfoxide reductase MsrB
MYFIKLNKGPSFYQPKEKDTCFELTDYKIGYKRTEVICNFFNKVR